MSTIKVSKVEPVTSGGDCIVNATNIVGNKNLIHNGAFQIAQRGTSSTTSGYGTIDRWEHYHASAEEAPTYTQHALTSSDTGPWEKGFRYSAHIQNGNQTGGASGSDELYFFYKIESQDISSSGWDYTSASSYITLSFWVKTSVAQNYYGNVVSRDGTNQAYPFETGSLSANTWTKIIKTIPGNSNIQIDNDNGQGLSLGIYAFNGTSYTASGVTLNQWGTKDNAAAVPDMTTTIWTTDDATFEITGVQLEVGDTATAFEHRTYADDLAICQRYYYQESSSSVQMNLNRSGGRRVANVPFPVTMRATPTVTITTQFDDGGATIAPDGANIYRVDFVQSSSNASNDAPNVSAWNATADL